MDDKYCMRIINSHKIMVNKYKAREILLEKNFCKIVKEIRPN